MRDYSRCRTNRPDTEGVFSHRRYILRLLLTPGSYCRSAAAPDQPEVKCLAQRQPDRDRRRRMTQSVAFFQVGLFSDVCVVVLKKKSTDSTSLIE